MSNRKILYYTIKHNITVFIYNNENNENSAKKVEILFALMRTQDILQYSHLRSGAPLPIYCTCKGD